MVREDTDGVTDPMRRIAKRLMGFGARRETFR